MKLSLVRMTVAAVALGATTLAQPVKGDTDKGLEVARLVDKANDGFVSEQGDAELVLIDTHGSQVSREISIRTREMNQDGDRSIVTFTAPADVAGTKLLTWAHGKSDDDQWLFLPAINRVKRISGRNKSGSFMGSEFSYEDLANPELDEFTYQYVKDTSVQGKDAWVYERRPRDTDSGYQREVLTVVKELMQPVKVEYYDRRNELLKVAQFQGFRKYGKYFRAGSIDMSNVQTGKKSRLQWHAFKVGDPIAEDAFRPDALGT